MLSKRAKKRWTISVHFLRVEGTSGSRFVVHEGQMDWEWSVVVNLEPQSSQKTSSGPFRGGNMEVRRGVRRAISVIFEEEVKLQTAQPQGICRQNIHCCFSFGGGRKPPMVGEAVEGLQEATVS